MELFQLSFVLQEFEKYSAELEHALAFLFLHVLLGFLCRLQILEFP